MSRIVSRAFPLASRSALRPPPLLPVRCVRSPPSPAAVLRRRNLILPLSSFRVPHRSYCSPRDSCSTGDGASPRRRSGPAAKRKAAQPLKERELLLDVKICIEEDLPDDPEILVRLTLGF
ncbi:hypothetical protein QJS10_CPB20g00576 [Acorus calamus]|uniref:Uncharacterized protein n=1 Tax=Acorus calamus TaxID=4465 RepID=A0AAV9C8X8_ACOCL|nr:hypothetical protein QJS10_CPB20g00576 [Acorus calamus]